MNRAVKTEIRKLRTLRTPLVGLLAALVLPILVTAAVVTTAGEPPNPPLGPDSFLELLAAPSSVLTVVALVLGILGMAGEHRHGTITTTLLATPRRADVVRAKLVVHAALGAVLALVSIATTAAVAGPWLGAEDVPVSFGTDGVGIAIGFVVSAALHGAVGVAIGALVPNQTVAIAGSLAWLLTVEGALSRFTGGLGDLLPGAAGAELVRLDGAPLVGGAVFAAYVVVAAVVGTAVLRRRDITA